MPREIIQLGPISGRWLACLLAAFASCGCGSRAEGELAPVVGIVLLDDQPLRAGTIITTPERGRGAHSTIDESGHFSLQTRGLGEGAVVGTHRIAVIVTTDGGAAALNPEAEVKFAIPSRYAHADSSGLEIDVHPHQEHEVTLRLASTLP
jgi:hypothetical protein